MKRSEWAKLSALVDGWWPATDFGADNEESYFAELERFDVAEVEQAFREALRDEQHRTYAPSLAWVLQRLERVDVPSINAPDFQRVLNRLGWAARRAEGTADTNPRWHAEVLAMLWGESALIGEWAQRYGIAQLMREQIDHPDFGGAVGRRLRQDWEGFLRTVGERAATRGVEAALAARPSLSELVAATSGGAAAGPRQLDAGSLLDG